MPSSMPEMAKFFWLLFGMLAIESANTCFGTPYAALAIDIAPDYNEQSKVQGFKTVFNIIGMILPSILMYFFMSSISISIQTGYTQQGYVNIAYINSALLIIFGLITIFSTLRYSLRFFNFSGYAFIHLLLSFFKFSNFLCSYCLVWGSDCISTNVGISFKENGKEEGINYIIVVNYFWDIYDGCNIPVS